MVYIDDETKAIYTGQVSVTNPVLNVTVEGKKLVTNDSMKPQDNKGGIMEYETKFSTSLDRKTAIDPDKTKITLHFNVSGVLKTSNGDEYAIDKPFDVSLNGAQLAAAIEACPNNWGYDVILDISELLNLEHEEQDTVITVTKIWDDVNDAQNKRPDAVTVTLKRTSDPVNPKDDWSKKVTLSKDQASDSNANIWMLKVSDLERWYTYEIGGATKRARYNYYIASEDNVNPQGEAVYLDPDISGTSVSQ